MRKGMGQTDTDLKLMAVLKIINTRGVNKIDTAITQYRTLFRRSFVVIQVGTVCVRTTT